MALYLVGGVVRDLLLGRKTLDLDLTVEGDGLAFARSVAGRYKASVVQYERFATARLVLPDGQKIDIASTRRESYADPAALPKVEPSSVRVDLFRRDFTINAMAVQLNAGNFGLLHDPYSGQRDLRSKTLRVLHEESFRDDPTRIFRAIRFMQRFGFSLESGSRRLLAEAAAANLISRLSGPRLRNEVLLLLAEHQPSRATDWLVRLNLLRFLHPRLRYTRRVKRLLDAVSPACAWWAKLRSAPSVERPVICLMALLSEAGPSILRSVAQRMNLSSGQSAAIDWSGSQTDLILKRLLQNRELRPSQVYRLLIGLPPEALVLLAAKMQLPAAGREARRCRQRLARYMKRDRHAAIAVRGEDLKKLGLKPGPRFKSILDRLLGARLDGKVKTEAEEREMAYRMVARSG